MQPLKNKKVQLKGYLEVFSSNNKYVKCNAFFKEKDVENAVIWLKDRIDYFESKFADFTLAREFKIMIDEAFSDVVSPKTSVSKKPTLDKSKGT
jgi:hypothetical protein